MDFVLGFIFSLLIAGLAFYKKSLSVSGFIAAMLVGTLLYGFATYIVFWLLMCFFITSSLFTKIHGQKSDKGRNYIQVLANSFVTVLFGFIYFITKEYWFLVLSAISIAVSTADTWASEIGKLSKGKTISIITFKQLNKGESGGISLLGTMASLLGAGFIALCFILLQAFNQVSLDLLVISFLIIVLAGFIGSIIDSLLGVLVQEKYLDLTTGKIIEKIKNIASFKKISGVKYINNDMVNFLSSLLTTLIFTMILLN